MKQTSPNNSLVIANDLNESTEGIEFTDQGVSSQEVKENGEILSLI